MLFYEFVFILYVILFVSTLAVLGAAVAVYHFVRRHMRSATKTELAPQESGTNETFNKVQGQKENA